MAGEWREVKLEEVAAPRRNALVGGPFGSNLVSADYVASGIPVIRGQNMAGRWVDGEFAFVTESKAKSLEANLARPGDLVFTQRGTLGQVALVPEHPFQEYLISQSQMKVSVDERKADPLFLYYLFNCSWQQDYIRQHAIQTGVPHTNLRILRNTPIVLPPLDEQHAIALVLGALDDKIELNRRISEMLEAMARALFKSWLVGFDPVRAKAEGRWRKGESLPGLPSLLFELFPQGFEGSELGDIPLGWRVVKLEDVTQRITDGSHYSPPSVSTGKAMASVKDMHEWGIDLRTCRRISEEEFNKLVRIDCRPLRGDVLVAKDGSYTTNVSSATVSILEKVALPPMGPPPGMHPASGAMPPPPGASQPRMDWNETVIPVGKGDEGFDVSPDGHELWTANAQDGSLSIIDISTKRVTSTLDAKIFGANRLKFTPDGKLVLITSLGNGDLVIYDARSRKEFKRVAIGHGAAGILMDSDGTRAFVACSPDDYVAILDLKTLAVTRHLDVGGNPDGLAWAVRP